MNLSPAKTFNKIKEFWVGLEKKRRRALIAAAVGVVALSVVLALILNHQSYAVLYTGLSPDEAGEILAVLDEMAVPTKIEDETTILVPEEDEARLKMKLAGEGYPQSTQNYDLFSQNVDFMTTDYEKRQYLLFQLQNRLQDAIETMDGIKGAVVTISVPDDNSYVLSEDRIPATASVVLNLRRNAGLDKQQIRGIEYLVANSVPGLDRKNVAIIDSCASLLNSPDTDSAISADKLSIESAVNQAVEVKVLKLLQPVFGYEALRVAVNTTVDTSQKVSSETKYSPSVDDHGMVSSQDLTRENDGTGAGGTGVPGTGSNTDTDIYAEQGDGEGTTAVNSTSNTDYLVNEFKEQIQKNGYEIKDISVSVMIGNPDLSENELSKYRQAVAFASGVEEDKISITTAEFLGNGEDNKTPTADTVGFDLFGIVEKYPLYFAIGAAVLAISLTVFILLMKKRKRRIRAEEEERAMRELAQRTPEDYPGEIVLNETRAQGLKRQIKEFSQNSPDIVAQMLRTWLKEE